MNFKVKKYKDTEINKISTYLNLLKSPVLKWHVNNIIQDQQTVDNSLEENIQ